MTTYSDDKNPHVRKIPEGQYRGGEVWPVGGFLGEAKALGFEQGWKACEKELKERYLILKRIEEDFEDPNIEDPEPII